MERASMVRGPEAQRDTFPRWATVVVSILVLSVLSPVQGAAQGGCQLSLQSATNYFEQGRFKDAKAATADCLDGVPRRAEKVQAYALLAKIHLAADNVPAAETAMTRLLSVDPEYEPDLFDPPRFVKLVARIKGLGQRPTVTSVSKSEESLLEAPATVTVITSEEIERRGYTDVEAVLHDLAGFDFSKLAGAGYSNIYQRGYRSIETNRTLLLIDGVEDNDLASFTAFISRQYPLSNIDRIEVVYGPASTMYGANAFAGVINIITKQPEQVVAEGNTFGYDAWLAGGTWSTGYLDAVIAGQTRTGSLSWSFAARKYDGNDFMHLEDYDAWDFDSAYYDTVNYQGLPNLNETDPEDVQSILDQYPNGLGPYFDVVYDADGNPTAIHLNEAGDARARELDLALANGTLNGAPIAYSGPVDDWMIDAKLKTSNMVFGMQMWRQMEASHVPLTDTASASGANGFTWTPEHTSLYMKYFKRFLDDKMSMTIFTRYKKHELDGSASTDILLRNYEGSFFPARMGIADLIEQRTPMWLPTYNYRSNNQLRAELNLFYDHSEKFNIVGGVELRYSSIGAKNIQSGEPPAGETGSPSNAITGGNQISSRDIGAYAQASYRPAEPLKLVLGVRFDNNKIRDTGGYGTVFNPRLAAVYTWRDFVFKAVYSEAFQDAPNFQKYETTGSRQLDNPNLAPEEVSNIELSAAWSPSDELVFQLALYQADYQGIVEQVSGVPCPEDLDCGEDGTTSQFQNVGSLDIKGAQAELRWTPGEYRFLANYTYTDPTDPDRDLRVGDIADHRINLLGESLFFNDRLDASLRLNGVFGRQTGAGTTASANPNTSVDDYVIANCAVTWRDLFVRGLDLQLAVNNLFDTEYFDPAFRNYPPAFVEHNIPQPTRTFYLRLRMAR